MMIEDIKQKVKYEELKKRYREAEEESDILQLKLQKVQKTVKRLQLEKTVLLERVERYQSFSNYHSDSETSLDFDISNSKSSATSFNYKHKPLDKHTIIKPPKKKKDPNAPRGPGNVYFLFCRLERDKIKDQVPEENNGEISKLLGAKWKSLTKEDKQVYYDTFKKEMEEFEEAMKIYKNTIVPAEEEEDTKRENQLKVSNLVEEGLTPYEEKEFDL